MSNPAPNRVPTITEMVANVRRNLRHMKEDIPLSNGNGRLLDYVEHIDTLMQEIGQQLDEANL